MMKYSVLMSVYHKEQSEFLNIAMDSMFKQTASPDEFVLVCDGPLTEELDAVISQKEKEYPSVLKVIRLDQNGGLGKALQIGIEKCRNELIARMDSDDISLLDRCEKQLKYMQNHPDISVVGGTIAEFETNPAEHFYKRVLPENSEELVEFSKYRNPFNHVSVMYRRKDVLDAGGYEHFPSLEDYYLWIRMFMKGYKGYNLQDTLTYVRVGNGMFSRRSGREYARNQRKLFRFMMDQKYITRTQYYKAAIGRTVVSEAPIIVRKLFYDMFLRQQ